MAAPMGRWPVLLLCRALRFPRRAEERLRVAEVRFGSTEVAAVAPVVGEQQAPFSEVPAADTVIGIRKKTYSEILAERQEQAKRTVLINCPYKISEKKLLKYLSSHGNVKDHFFYETHGLYAVIEFSKADSIASMQDGIRTPQLENEGFVPFKSRIFTLTYKNPPNDDAEVLSVPRCAQTAMPVGDLVTKLCKANSVSDQLLMLTEMYQLTEENTRLRFLVCSLVQDITEAYFPNCTVKPFGSSVNTFGKLGCDLDMLLDLDEVKNMNRKKTGPFKLEYLIRRVPNQRVATQRILSAVAEFIDNCGPGCIGVQKILHARCPLVKFSHQPSGFQCDLTANNRIAFKSSELLYLYGSLDPRVRVLVFSVRCWARVHGITNIIPGHWVTNFALTLMVLFFLQKRKPYIIPTLDQLKGLADAEDKQIIEGYDCTFVSNLNKIEPTKNTETLDMLLLEFFQFYGKFDFNKYSLNIRKGREQNKPEAAALHIQNPFESNLNVSKNVSAAQLERFVTLAQDSAWLLHQELNDPSSNRSQPWGLAALLHTPAVKKNGHKQVKTNKIQAIENIRGLLASLKSNAQSGKRSFGTQAC
uniref:Poly(A) RNA polymerase, mitochondrial n=1 Tax=Pogona vitticeps TaxID=103695 RepID=A0A6J0U772_9SAUR